MGTIRVYPSPGKSPALHSDLHACKIRASQLFWRSVHELDLVGSDRGCIGSDLRVYPDLPGQAAMEGVET